jgi:nanoRNase/pAp phosphatase (c-di-AMP/oligoRNAs hydrolase)
MTETTDTIVAVDDRTLVVLEKLKKLLQDKKYKRAAVFTHAYPDPDAIGSLMGVEWLLTKLIGLESHGYFVGPISHPQNIMMVNLLDPNMRPVVEYKPDDHDLHILVDTVPTNAGIGNSVVNFDLVIDHHKEVCPPDFKGLFINLRTGSCAATVYHLIKSLGLNFSDQVDADAKVVTALLIGITTDTENLMSDDSTEYEFNAWSGLFPYRNPSTLREIANFDRPKFWIDTKAKAMLNYTIEDGVGIVGLGIIPARHRDMISDMAQEMVQWENVETAIAFALVDGSRIEGSIRSVNSALSVPKLCSSLGGKFGCGGGKLGKGAYKVELAGGGIEDDDSESIKQKTWDLNNEKERQRIMKIVRK